MCSSSLAPYRKLFTQKFLNSLSTFLSLRASFFLVVFLELASVATSYLALDILFRRIEMIGAWDRTHFMFFAFWSQTVMNGYQVVAAPNFWSFSSELRSGNLDFRLVRPLGSLFDTFTAFLRPVTLLVLPINVGLLIYYGTLLHLSWLQWLAIPFLLLLSFAVTVLVDLTLAMSLFWTTGGDGINFIRVELQGVRKWPDFLYPDGFRVACTYLVPLLAATTFSVRAVLGEGEWLEIPFLLASAVALWFLIGRLWKAGLRRYESASS